MLEANAKLGVDDTVLIINDCNCHSTRADGDTEDEIWHRRSD